MKLFKIISSRYLKRIPNKEHIEKFKDVSLFSLYLESIRKQMKYKEFVSKPTTLCIFIGYPSSGSSIVGSCLDANRQSLISHELDIVYLVESGFTKNQILSLAVDNSVEFSKYGRGWSNYSYQIARQHQGKYRGLKVIGDKMAAMTTFRIKNRVELVPMLNKRMKMEIKYVHHIRNPFDTIATMCIKNGLKKVNRKTIRLYLDWFKTVKKIESLSKPNAIYHATQENFIAQPKQYLSNLCSFLNIEYTDQYLKACEKIVVRKPSITRRIIKWGNKDLDYLKNNIDQHQLLSRYTY